MSDLSHFLATRGDQLVGGSPRFGMEKSICVRTKIQQIKPKKRQKFVDISKIFFRVCIHHTHIVYTSILQI